MCMIVHVLQDMDEYAPWALECQSRPLYTTGTTKRDNENLQFITRSKNTVKAPTFLLILQSVYIETTGTHNNYIIYPCVWHGRGCNAMLLNQTSFQIYYIFPI